jgi:hypothetical protein
MASYLDRGHPDIPEIVNGPLPDFPETINGSLPDLPVLGGKHLWEVGKVPHICENVPCQMWIPPSCPQVAGDEEMQGMCPARVGMGSCATSLPIFYAL